MVARFGCPTSVLCEEERFAGRSRAHVGLGAWLAIIMTYLAKNTSLIKKTALIFGIAFFLATSIEAQDATQVYKAAAPAVASLEALDPDGNVSLEWNGVLCER
jgi:hypothetical protein